MLYEVITKSIRSKAITHCWISAARSISAGFLIFFRITSYNVCYTKLLRKASIETIKFIKDNFILFVSCYDDSDDKAILYALSYSGNEGKKLGKEKKLFEAPVEKKKFKGSFIIITSKDLSKVLVNHYAFYKKEGKLKDRYNVITSYSIHYTKLYDNLPSVILYVKASMDFIVSTFP